ncbi:MAG: hypothetical protein HY894_01455 [Deltaproteobacteria bacterium]|nr:hypothetical protein [Deltaproteobacteria bacterium]
MSNPDDKRLNIAFVWHMHQPLYKDPLNGEYVMPWALYHGTKDYYDMAAILDEFPSIHQTFNLVPSLIGQLQDYASGNAIDRYRTVTALPASRLAPADKAFIIHNFFQANWDNMIRPFPRYMELAMKRGHVNSDEDVRAAVRYFDAQDYLDLQTLFNLSWIDPAMRQADPALAALVEKGRGYTEEDKSLVLGKQTEIVGRILPKYKEMQERGIIEVTTTPYYHPIMPLLCDSFSARTAMPEAAMPKERFVHPEDAAAQIRKAVALYKKIFGAAPRGMWPSEGSVSMDVIPLAAAEGITWLATDEEILSNTLKRPIRRDAYGNCQDPFLYRPYSINAGAASVALIFRDHLLSDLIGFDYAKMDPPAAARDMVERLDWIARAIPEPHEHLVSIILDGENAWENYCNDGRDFLAALYGALESHERLRCVTVSEFLGKTALRDSLQWLYPGSWISHNFKIWIGHHEDNAAWDYINEARGRLVEYEAAQKGTGAAEARKAIDDAWEEVYAAEGSDWFWWYGDEHSSLSDEHFDALFRNHIKKIYSLMGQEPPGHLDVPIISEARGTRPAVEPSAYLHPKIDGEVTNYFEWLAAGRFEQKSYGSSMHREMQSGGILSAVLYGFSTDALYMRFDYAKDVKDAEKSWTFSINFIAPKAVKINGEVAIGASRAELLEKDPASGRWTPAPDGADIQIASGTVVELRAGCASLNVQPGAEMRLFINIEAKGRGPERWPLKGCLCVNAPAAGFEEENWSV